MAIEQRVFCDKMEILADGQVQVRMATQFFENGAPISSKSFERHVVVPGDDVSQEDQIVRDAVNGNLHSQERVQKFLEDNPDRAEAVRVRAERAAARE